MGNARLFKYDGRWTFESEGCDCCSYEREGSEIETKHIERLEKHCQEQLAKIAEYRAETTQKAGKE